MSKTIDLRQELDQILGEITEKVFYEEAPEERPYPYVVIELREVLFGDGKTTYQLEVNVLDYGDDLAVAEIMADEIQDVLDHRYVITDAIQFTIYRESRQTVKEEDKKIIRRRMLFEIHLHERK